MTATQQKAIGVSPAGQLWRSSIETNLATVYYSFVREAELQDQGALVSAAAWHTLGKVICALISNQPNARIPDPLRQFLSEIRDRNAIASISQRLERIRRELDLLNDAGRKGGSVTASTAIWFANALLTEFKELRDQLCHLYALCMPNTGSSIAADAEGLSAPAYYPQPREQN
jgi:hypothetical protein